MLVEISPASYLAICGLIQDALLHPSDASLILARASHELRSATAGGMIPSELTEQPAHLEALRRGGMAS